MKIVKPLLLICLLTLQGYTFAQKVLTLEESMDIAIKNSPSIQKSRMNMDMNREYLNAQLASLKSNFFLDITPVSFSRVQMSL